MGNWISNDPTSVPQILISSSYSPPPPEGFVSPMTWGIEDNVLERFAGAGVPKENISFARDTYTFNFPGKRAELVYAFRKYYGPTMNAFELRKRTVEPVIYRRSWKVCSTVRIKALITMSPAFLRRFYALPQCAVRHDIVNGLSAFFWQMRGW